jgi:hypothetical protein
LINLPLRHQFGVCVLTEHDERKGLVKLYWQDVRERVAKVNPGFAKLVDEISPNETFPVYLAYYPYGAMTGDTISPFIPKMEGDYYRLSDPNAPPDIIKHLGYGMHSAPLAMILEKNKESFVDLKGTGITIPRTLQSPGDIFPIGRIFNINSSRFYAPNGVLSGTAGARSVFLLPNIGCATSHINLQRDFNVKSSPVKLFGEHHQLFKEIINSNVIDCNWRFCLLYFSEKWATCLNDDSGWQALKIYLYDYGWKTSEYLRHQYYYDIIFSVIQRKRNLKPNPYLVDTACYLFSSALGITASYAPACNNDALPLDLLQKVFVESYGLKRYLPTIMQPTHYSFESDTYPSYYSLKNPSTHVFSPKSRTVSSTLYDMRELEYITRIFAEELGGENSMCADTIMGKIAREVEFKYFHNEEDRHHVVRSAAQITDYDDRFNSVDSRYKVAGAKFASDAPFVRGCVSISRRSAIQKTIYKDQQY